MVNDTSDYKSSNFIVGLEENQIKCRWLVRTFGQYISCLYLSNQLAQNIGLTSFHLQKNIHWRSAPYALNVRNKNSNIQGKPPNVVKVIFHTIRNCS